MTPFEITSSILGILGFILGLFNLGWSIWRSRSCFYIDTDGIDFFRAQASRENMFGEDFSSKLNVLDIALEISNISNNANTVKSIKIVTKREQLHIDDDCRFITETYCLDMSEITGTDPNLQMATYWNIPEQLEANFPSLVQSGNTLKGNYTRELDGDLIKDTEKIKITVIVTDAYGKNHKRKLNVKYRRPISQTNSRPRPDAPDKLNSRSI